MNEVKEWMSSVHEAIGKVFFGKQDVIDKVAVALLCRGHVLIEDVPGVGKTIIGRAMARAIECDFKQVQCTPDLLPADVLGVSVFNPKTQEFEFKKGPVITNLLLVDEINRATPRTQSALLEAMAEGQVSVEGKSMPLPNPFFLLATESPTESEGTFPLPEVQKDRFFLSLKIGYPDLESERMILKSKDEIQEPLTKIQPVTDISAVLTMQERILSVHVDESLADYIHSIINATRQESRLVLGVSPRGSLALFRGSQALAAIRGREFVTPEDIKEIAYPVLRKRILIKSEFSSRGVTEDGILSEILNKLPVPGLDEAV
jgi:MoxR-like ATPase